MSNNLIIKTAALRKSMRDLTGLTFEPGIDRKVSPSRPLAALADLGAGLRQFNGRWGVPRPGYRGLVYTEDAAIVTKKDIFIEAFQTRRCVIPCSGWIEDESHFASREHNYMLLAALWFGDESNTRFIILTTVGRATFQSRVPLLLPPLGLKRWITSSPKRAQDWLRPSVELVIEARQAA